MRKGTLVIQPSPGIGDMIWHLPHLRAIAHYEGPLTLMSKSRSLVKEWLQPDPNFHDFLYVDRGSLSFIIPFIQRKQFQKAWILHRSLSYAVIPFVARIPERVGFGYNMQKYLLTSQEGLPENLKSTHTIKQLNAMMKRAGYELKSEDQCPPVSLAVHQKIMSKFFPFPKPWISLGIGASADFKRWPLSHFATLGVSLSSFQKGTVFLCGSAAEEEDACFIQKLIHDQQGRAEILTDLSITEMFAFLKECDLYVGNDTSLLNIACSFGVPTFGLFGATEPLNYVSNIYPLSCPSPHLTGKEAMAAIDPHEVFSHVKHNHVFQKFS